MDQNAPTPPADSTPSTTAWGKVRGAAALITSPLWVPLVLVRGLTRICGEGLLFSAETLRGQPVEIASPPLRFLFDLFAVIAFPVFVAVETCRSLLVSLSLMVLPARPLSQKPRPMALRLLLGLVLLLLAPAWFPLYGVFWLLSRLFTELIRPTVGRVARGEPALNRGGRFETFVALRYMRGRKSAGVSVVTGLTTAGVTVGVWTLIVVLSVMAGFEKDLQDKILGSNSHVIVRSYWNSIENWEQVKEVVDATEGVKASTPFLYTEFMLRHGESVTGAIFKGIHPPSVGLVTDVLDNLIIGPRGKVGEGEAADIIARLDDPDWPEALSGSGEAKRPPELPGVVIGKEMAADLAVTVGDVIRGVSPVGEPGPMGMTARVEEFVVVGIFHSGMYEYDTKFAYATIDTVKKFLKGKRDVTGLEIKVHDIYEAPRIAGLIGAKLAYPIWTQDWQKMNEGLFKALKLEKTVMGIILTFIVAVACLNIISTLSMMVIEKAREIAILKAMGAGRLAILKLFMIDGLIVGFIGTVLGIGLGLVTCWALGKWQFIPLSSDVYYVDTLPVYVAPGMVAAVAVIAITIAFLSTLYPSSEAASLDPVDGLRDG